MYFGNLTKEQFKTELAILLRPIVKELDELRKEFVELRSNVSSNIKDYYSSKELELLLGVSRSTIHNWTKQGKLHKHILSEGKVLYKWSDVEKLLKNSKK